MLILSPKEENPPNKSYKESRIPHKAQRPRQRIKCKYPDNFPDQKPYKHPADCINNEKQACFMYLLP